MSNFMEQDLGFCHSREPGAVAAYAKMLSLIENLFYDRNALLKIKDAASKSDGIDPRDISTLVSRCDYYLWDIDRQQRGVEATPTTWGLDDDPETVSPDEKAADFFADNLDLLTKARIWVDPYVREDAEHVTGYWRQGGPAAAKLFEVGDFVELDPSYEWNHPDQRDTIIKAGNLGRVIEVKPGEEHQYVVSWMPSRMYEGAEFQKSSPSNRDNETINRSDQIRRYDHTAAMKQVKEYQAMPKLGLPTKEHTKELENEVTDEQINTLRKVEAWKAQPSWRSGEAWAFGHLDAALNWDPWEPDLSDPAVSAKYWEGFNSLLVNPILKEDWRLKGALASQDSVLLVMQNGERKTGRVKEITDDGIVFANFFDMSAPTQTLSFSEIKTVLPDRKDGHLFRDPHDFTVIPVGAFLAVKDGNYYKNEDGTWRQSGGDQKIPEDEVLRKRMVYAVNGGADVVRWFEMMDVNPVTTERMKQAMVNTGNNVNLKSGWHGTPLWMNGTWSREMKDGEIKMIKMRLGNGVYEAVPDVPELTEDEFVDLASPYLRQLASYANAKNAQVAWARVDNTKSMVEAGIVTENGEPGEKYQQQLDAQIAAGRALDAEMTMRISEKMVPLGEEIRALDEERQEIVRRNQAEAQVELEQVGQALSDMLKEKHNLEVTPRNISALLTIERNGIVYGEPNVLDMIKLKITDEIAPFDLPNPDQQEEINKRAAATWQDVWDTTEAIEQGEQGKKVEALGRQINPLWAKRKMANERVARVRRDAYQETMKKARKMTKNTRKIKYAKGTDKKSKTLLEWSAQWFPSDWMNLAAEDDLSVVANFSEERGHFNASFVKADGERARRIKISPRTSVTEDPEGTPVAVHELGHYMEILNEDIASMQWAYWHRRRNNSTDRNARNQTRKLNNIKPGSNYDDDEVAVEDEYRSVYSGKTYTESGKPGKAWELLTMGIEDIVTGGGPQLIGRDRPVWDDADYRHWLLGLLAGV